MTTFLFVAFGLIFFLSWYLKRHDNPYKLTFIFGKKGSGKSCYMVNLMLKYLKRGWVVYTDMKDIRIPGVRIFNTADLSIFKPEPHSVVFLDEVGISMDNRSYASFPPGLRDFFKYIRKMEVCCYMNSQAFDVDKKVRDTTDAMVLQVAVGNVLSISRPIIRRITLTEPSAQGDSRIADCLLFARPWHWRFYWMPKYFKYFNSKEMPDRELLPYKEPVDTIEIGKGVLYHVRQTVGKYLHWS